MHMPDRITPEYVAQLTSEKVIRKHIRGRGSVRQWIKTRERNEALDLEVYALAALHILGAPYIRALASRAAKFSVRVVHQLEMGEGIPREAPPAPQAPALEPSPRPAARPGRRRKSWVYKGWK